MAVHNRSPSFWGYSPFRAEVARRGGAHLRIGELRPGERVGVLFINWEGVGGREMSGFSTCGSFCAWGQRIGAGEHPGVEGCSGRG